MSCRRRFTHRRTAIVQPDPDPRWRLHPLFGQVNLIRVGGWVGGWVVWWVEVYQRTVTNKKIKNARDF